VTRVRLRPGTDPERAIALLREIVGGKSLAIRPTSQNPVDKRDDYVRWATMTEAQLESVLRREDAQAFFDNPRHRDICSMAPGNQLTPLIYAEVDAKAADLEEAKAYLERQRNRLRASDGLPIVVDTNVLLQCQRLDQVKWMPVVSEEARVMVPLRVIEETEDKKYSDSKRLSRRARALLPWIDKHFVDGSPGPVSLTNGATIELIVAERPRYRPDSADDEILEVAQDVSQFAGRVKLMTGDTGMRARAKAEGTVLALPENWRIPPDDDE